MGNRPHKNCISTCYDQTEEDLLTSHFPLDSAIVDTGVYVYVPFWNGPMSIYALQRVHPKDVPIHALPESFDLPGETVPAVEVPDELYQLIQTEALSYNRGQEIQQNVQAQFEQEVQTDDEYSEVSEET